MASIQAKFGWSSAIRKSYTCSAAVTGGRLVEETDDNIVAHAGAGSLRCVGAAQHDVPATRATIQGPQVGDGNELTVLSHCEVPLTASGAINQGDRVIAAANGLVSAAGATPDARTVIGYAVTDIADTAIGYVRLFV